jgi:flagellar assembly factor FliW
MQIDTLRFGVVEVDETKLLMFDTGIPGLEEYHKYALLQFEDSYPIIWLQSMDDGGVCLPVLDTYSVLDDYVFDIEEADVEELAVRGPEDLHVVSVLVIPDDIKGMTVNLAAPIIINTVTGKAKQIILGGSSYNVRVPVFQEICSVIMKEEGDADAGTVTKAE